MHVHAHGQPSIVFAPTDEAFARLPDGTVESLLKPENKGQLAAILKYYVVVGQVFAADAIKAGKAATLRGQSVTPMRVRVQSCGLDGSWPNWSRSPFRAAEGSAAS